MTLRALLIGFLVLAMLAAGCSGDDDDTSTPTVAGDAATSTSVEVVEVPTTTVPPVEVIEGAFTFADDDLCEWVSVEMVAEFVATEFDDPDVTVVLDESSGGPENPDSCRWWFLASTAPDEFGSVLAENAEFPWLEYITEVEVVDFDEEGGFVEIGSTVSGHPSLSDGVVVYNGAWGQYVFWVPPSDEYLLVTGFFPRKEGEDGDDWDDYEDRVFGVADRFVQELGWLG